MTRRADSKPVTASDNPPPAEVLLTRTVAVVVLIGAVLASFWAYRIARADYLAGLDTVPSLREAVAMLPGNAKPYARLAELDRASAGPLLERALTLNPYDASVLIELGLLRESEGSNTAAETLLKRAAEVDHTYLPEWTLVNYYARHDNEIGFWKAAHLAGLMKPTQLAGLLQMCWRMSPDPKRISQQVVPDDYLMVRTWTLFLLDEHQYDEAGKQGERLLRLSPKGETRNLEVLFETVDAQIANDHLGAAGALWEAMERHAWIPAYRTAIYNGQFQTAFLQHGFGWKNLSCDGVFAGQEPGGGVRIEFSGEQPESCGLIENTVLAGPGTYKLRYEVKADTVPPDTGVQWQVFSAAGQNELLAQSKDLLSRSNVDELPVTVPEGASGIRLRLDYRRAVGTKRLNGTVTVDEIVLKQ